MRTSAPRSTVFDHHCRNKHLQRHSEAAKSEKLMIASVTDELTGIPNVKGFTDKAFEQLKTINKDNLVYLFINIENFKLYND